MEEKADYDVKRRNEIYKKKLSEEKSDILRREIYTPETLNTQAVENV